MPKPQLNWVDKFRIAIRGIGWGIAGQASFAVHLPVAIFVILLAALLRLEPIEWIVLVFCIGLVFSAELFNSALELLFQGLSKDKQDQYWKCLDIAAGAVLMASLTAIVIGGIVFIPRLYTLLMG